MTGKPGAQAIPGPSREFRHCQAGDPTLRSPSGWVAVNFIAAERQEADHGPNHPEHPGNVD